MSFPCDLPRRQLSSEGLHSSEQSDDNNTFSVHLCDIL
jgi:hypothetical protein